MKKLPFPGTIFLIGLRASGKTTVGRKLAQGLGYKHVDQDNEFFKSHGSISSFVAANGWDKFYVEFHKVLIGLDIKKAVVSTGGSVFMANEKLDIDRAKVSFCRERGVIIMLSPAESVDEASRISFARLSGRDETIFGGSLPPENYEEFEGEYIKKYPRYLASADWVVYDNVSPDSAVQKIMTLLKSKYLPVV